MVPSEGFDWVTERHGCNLSNVFKRLHIGVEHDVETRNSQLTPLQKQEHVLFYIKDLDAETFLVRRDGAGIVTLTEFKLNRTDITVRTEDRKIILIGTIMLNDQGQCKLRLNDGIELEDWQIRRRALEELFFGF